MPDHPVGGAATATSTRAAGSRIMPAFAAAAGRHPVTDHCDEIFLAVLGVE
jgi:hypothetical protein